MKYVIWDWNGTLFDDLDFCLESINLLLQRHGLAPLPDIDAYKRVFRFPIREYYRDLGFQFDKTPYEELACEYMDIIHDPGVQDRCRLQREALYTLDCLQYLGLRQIILSVSEQGKLENQVRRLGVYGYFYQILGISDIYGQSKAELARSLRAENLAPPHEMLYIGDSLHDAEAADILGCKCLLFAGGHQYLPPDGTGYTVIERLSEVLDYV